MARAGVPKGRWAVAPGRPVLKKYRDIKSSPIKYDILDEITETRIYCGFRENMIQVANRPCDEVALEWPICLHLESLIQDVMYY